MVLVFSNRNISKSYPWNQYLPVDLLAANEIRVLKKIAFFPAHFCRGITIYVKLKHKECCPIGFSENLLLVAYELDGLNVHYAGVKEDFVKAIKAEGLKLYVRTVNDAAEAKRVKKFRVDVITTDQLDLMLEQLREDEK